MMPFTVTAQDPACGARLGVIDTPHGRVSTPAFMPVGTQGTVKALTPEQVGSLGAEIILGNTYHLMLRPGHRLIAGLGGLHRFMHWPHPILTDSGGFQVYSLGNLRTMTEEGATFQSHIDGSRHVLTPETAVEIQEALGSDIMMCLDECIAYPAPRRDTERALGRTARWAARCKASRQNASQALFGIVQGGCDRELRRRGVEEIAGIGFDGYALGGAERRRTQGTPPGDGGGDSAASAGGPAPVPDGRGDACGHRRRGVPRDRHVRLRDADPIGPQRIVVYKR